MELVGITLSKTYCTHKLFMHTYVQIPYFPYFNTVTTHTQEYMAGGWVVLGLVLYLRGRNQWQLPAEMNTHKHTHNCTMIFTRNIGEVMALWAISLSSSAVEVQRKRFQSLITEQSSHSTHTDRYLSQRYTAADKIQHESFAVHTSITDTDDGLFTSKTHYDESKKKWGMGNNRWSLAQKWQTGSTRLLLSVNTLLSSVSTSYLGFYRFGLLSFCWSWTVHFYTLEISQTHGQTTQDNKDNRKLLSFFSGR